MVLPISRVAATSRIAVAIVKITSRMCATRRIWLESFFWVVMFSTPDASG